MTDREFFEKLEVEFRSMADRLKHTPAGKTVCHPYNCPRCRLERLADECADRAFRSAA